MRCHVLCVRAVSLLCVWGPQVWGLPCLGVARCPAGPVPLKKLRTMNAPCGCALVARPRVEHVDRGCALGQL